MPKAPARFTKCGAARSGRARSAGIFRSMPPPWGAKRGPSQPSTSSRTRAVSVDFTQHAASMGAKAETVQTISELEQALDRAKAADRTYVVVIKTDPVTWTPGDAWWDVGVPAVSEREAVRKAYAEQSEGKKKQRLGV